MVLNDLTPPDLDADDPRDDPFPREPTPEDAVLPLPGDDGGERVERAGFGVEPD